MDKYAVRGARTPAMIRSRRVSAACGLAAILVGLAVLMGWEFSIDALRRIVPAAPDMTAITAVALTCSGAALVCFWSGSHLARAGRVLGGFVALIGLLVLFEYLVTPVGIDQLLFRDPGVLDPGRPSPHTALALVALGSALMTVDLRRLPGWVHQAWLGMTAVVVVFALVGYLYGVDYLRGVSGTNGMAIHTLATLIVLTIGVTALSPERGLLGITRGDGAGAIVARAIVPLAIAPVLIGAELFGLQRDGILGVRLALSIFTLSMVLLLTATVLVLALRARGADARARGLATQLQAIFDNAPAALSLRDLEGRYLHINEYAASILGQTPNDLIGTQPARPALAEPVVAADREIQHSHRPVTSEQRVTDSDGGERDLHVIRYPVLGELGEILAFGTFAFDITEQKRTVAAMELAQTRFRSTFEEAPIGMMLLDLDGRLEQVNEALCQILGYDRGDLEGAKIAEIIHPEDLEATQLLRTALQKPNSGSQTLETHWMHASGHAVVVDIHVTLLRDPEGAPLHFLAQLQDVTERKRQQKQLEYLADHDSLTGLHNRRAFGRALAQHTSGEQRLSAGGSLMAIDLDNLKQINDTLGHHAGDQLITEAAGLLTRELRSTDTIARLGGDEFAVLLPATPLETALKVAENLLAALRDQHPSIAGLNRPISASIGVTAFTGRGDETADQILGDADLAMYEAKTSGRNRIHAAPSSPELVRELAG